MDGKLFNHLFPMPNQEWLEIMYFCVCVGAGGGGSRDVLFFMYKKINKILYRSELIELSVYPLTGS